MKSILFIFVLTLGTISLNAQMRYVPGDTVKGKNASYYCEQDLPKRTVKVRNVQNKDTLSKVYLDNGEEVLVNMFMSDSENAYQHKDIVQAFKNVLTSQELEQIKGENCNLSIEFTVDKSGNAQEITFIIRYSDPVLSRIDPDRLYKLEVQLKQLLKLKLGPKDQKIKNLKYWISIDYHYHL